MSQKSTPRNTQCTIPGGVGWFTTNFLSRSFAARIIDWEDSGRSGPDTGRFDGGVVIVDDLWVRFVPNHGRWYQCLLLERIEYLEHDTAIFE